MENLVGFRHKHKSGGKQEFCISTQHYSFAVNAFVDLIKEYGSENYDFSLRETQTYEIIDDVARMKSEIGILYLNEFNASVLEKIMKANDLKFTELFVQDMKIRKSLDLSHIWILYQNFARQKSIRSVHQIMTDVISFSETVDGFLQPKISRI